MTWRRVLVGGPALWHQPPGDGVSALRIPEGCIEMPRRRACEATDALEAVCGGSGRRYCLTSSTRRLRALPSSVSFVATGANGPLPKEPGLNLPLSGLPGRVIPLASAVAAGVSPERLGGRER